MSQPFMRHGHSWTDLVDLRVGIWGLGVEGLANVRQAVSLGLVPLLVDLQKSGEQVEGLLVDGDADKLFDCDVVIKTPGISRYQDRVQALEATGIPVVGGHGLWLNGIDGNRVAAVTGTKGKSTTVAVVGHLFTRLGIDGAIGGNIGVPPFDPALDLDPHYWCLELSSYQVTDLAVRPKVAAVTSLSPDHVEWHRSLERYYSDKLSLATLSPSVDDAVVFAAASGGELFDHRSSLGSDPTWVAADDRSQAMADAFGLRGRHNHGNVAMALAIVECLTGREFALAELVEAAHGFEHLGSRLTPVATFDGVEFVDDCLSTNTLPTIAALDVFGQIPTVLIAGGFDRGIDYGPLGERLAQAVNPVFVLCLDEPDNGATIAAAVEHHRVTDLVQVAMVQSLEVAVETGFAWCRGQGGGVVLLSPAAPTRGQALAADGSIIPTRFSSYGAKADAFAKVIRRLETATLQT